MELKKLFIFTMLMFLIGPIGLAQLSPSDLSITGDNGATISVIPPSGYSGPRGPGSLTTLFASNNGYAGNMFDITPAKDMSITAIDVNTSEYGLPCDVEVWYIPGTCVGNTNSPLGWTLLDTGTNIGAGADAPTHIPLANGGATTFKSGQVYGIYVHFTNYSVSNSCRYTNGQLTFSNSDLSLVAHFGKGDPAFFGATFSPRTWNGTLYYDDPGTSLALVADKNVIPSKKGGVINFSLNATMANGGRNYALIAGASGTGGWNLPSGLNVPVTWDAITSLLIKTGWGMGTLDLNGKSKEALTIPAIPQPADVILSFAYFLEGSPLWDFVSNGVDVTIQAYIKPLEYSYDDGTTEKALGLTNGGDICWINIFDAGPGDLITSLSSAFGYPNHPGKCPGAGTPITVAIWDDPNNDNDPSDGVFLASANGLLANPDTQLFNQYSFTSPVAVKDCFVVGCVVTQLPGQLPAPMDTSSFYHGRSWVAGAAAGAFDYNIMSNNAPVELGSIGFPANWLLRAQY